MALRVLHLVWTPLGPAPLARFLAAYRQHPPGCDHELSLIVNGGRRAFVEELAPDVDRVELPRPVQDLEAYRLALDARPADRWCLLNSYSVPLAADWLAKLTAPLGTGRAVASATASWESFLTHHPLVPPVRQLARRSAGRPARARVRMGIEDVVDHVGIPRSFGPFPNVHLRSNALALDAGALRALRWPPVSTKGAAHRLESGRDSLSARARRSGRELLVVDRDGDGHPDAAWPASRTFRSGAQEALLVADNRTEEYARGDADVRERLGRLAWGEAYVAA